MVSTAAPGEANLEQRIQAFDAEDGRRRRRLLGTADRIAQAHLHGRLVLEEDLDAYVAARQAWADLVVPLRVDEHLKWWAEE